MEYLFNKFLFLLLIIKIYDFFNFKVNILKPSNLKFKIIKIFKSKIQQLIFL